MSCKKRTSKREIILAEGKTSQKYPKMIEEFSVRKREKRLKNEEV